MPLQTYGGFQRMTTLCKTYIPQSISQGLEPIKNDEAQVKDYGHVVGVEMCRRLLRGGTPGLHFYTLNLEVLFVCLFFLFFFFKKKLGECSCRASHLGIDQ